MLSIVTEMNDGLAPFRLLRRADDRRNPRWLAIVNATMHEALATTTLPELADVVARRGQELFGSTTIGIALLHGRDLEIVQHGCLAGVPPSATVPGELLDDCRPGDIVEIGDLARFARRYSAAQPYVDHGLASIVAAPFGEHQISGYLSFFSTRSPEFSDDELNLIVLVASVVGLAVSRLAVSNR